MRIYQKSEFIRNVSCWIEFEGLGECSPTTQLIGMNRPIIPKPQERITFRTLKAISPSLRISIGCIYGNTRLKHHICEEWGLKHKLEFVENQLENSSPDNHFEAKLESLTKDQKDQAYFLAVNEKKIRCIAASELGLYYGLMTLAQLIHKNQDRFVIERCEIFDYPTYILRGTTDQLCHGQVGTVESIKRHIRFLSRYKNNMLGLNLEDVMLFDAWPHIGEPRGALTAAEIKEITEYAHLYFIEVFPGFQALGHLENFLYHPEFRDLAEFPGANSLNLANPRSYEILEQLYSEICQKFNPNHVHIELDEAYDFGVYASKSLAEKKGRPQILLDHIQWVYDLLHNKLNKEVIMYHDTVLNWGKDILDQIPKDIKIICWNYISLPKYPFIQEFTKRGFFVFVSPSIINWHRPFPYMKHAIKNIVKIAQEGVKSGAKGFMNSIWGDFSNENLRENYYYGLAVGSDCAWNPLNFDIEYFQVAFVADFFGMHNPHLFWDTIMLLSNFNTKGAWHTPFFHSLWEHPVLPKGPTYPPKQAKKDLKLMTQVEEMLGSAKKMVSKNSDLIDYLEYAIRIIKFNAEKVLTCQQISLYWKRYWIRYPPGVQQLAQIQKAQQKLWENYEDLWLRCAKPEGLERIKRNFDAQQRVIEEIMALWKNGDYYEQPLLLSEWIKHPSASNNQKPHYFRKKFHLSQEDRNDLQYAKIQAIANHYLKIRVNNHEVGEIISRFYLSPVIFDNLVKIFDISQFIVDGENVIEIEAWEHTYGTISANIYSEICKTNGNKLVITSDETWAAADEEERLKDKWVPASSLGKPPAFNGEIWSPNLALNIPSWISRKFGKKGYTESLIFMATKKRWLAKILSKFG